jgi:hypothetical protein
VANEIPGRQIVLKWTNPTDLDFKGVRILASTIAFVQQSSVTQGVSVFEVLAATTFAHSNLTEGVTYYYSLFTFDMQSTPNFSAGVFASAVALPPLAPPAQVRKLRGQFSPDQTTFRITWGPVTKRTSGVPLPSNELVSYKVLRSSLYLGATNQTYIIPASSPTQIVDTVNGQLYFYIVKAVDIYGFESPNSDIIRSDGTEETLVLMNDEISFVQMSNEQYAELEEKEFRVEGTRREEREGGIVFKYLEVRVLDQDDVEQEEYVFDEPVIIAIGYLVDTNGVVSSGAPGIGYAKVLPTATEAQDNFSMYWYTGSQWLKLGSEVDTEEQVVTVETRLSGDYQLRLVSQAEIQQNSAYPRTITPNGDTINDKVFFFFENRTDSPIQGKIYDVRGAKIADTIEEDILSSNNSVLSWDGKDYTGSTVPGGVYLYKIEVAGEIFTGTVVVAR